MIIFNVSYNVRKSTWSQLPDISILSEAELIESLTIHSYDADINEKHIRILISPNLLTLFQQILKIQMII